MSKFGLLERIKEVAKLHKLLAVGFLNRDGRMLTQLELTKITPSKVKLEFSNGEEFTISYQDFNSFEDFKFQLAKKCEHTH